MASPSSGVTEMISTEQEEERRRRRKEKRKARKKETKKRKKKELKKKELKKKRNHQDERKDDEQHDDDNRGGSRHQQQNSNAATKDAAVAATDEDPTSSITPKRSRKQRSKDQQDGETPEDDPCRSSQHRDFQSSADKKTETVKQQLKKEDKAEHRKQRKKRKHPDRGGDEPPDDTIGSCSISEQNGSRTTAKNEDTMMTDTAAAGGADDPATTTTATTAAATPERSQKKQRRQEEEVQNGVTEKESQQSAQEQQDEQQPEPDPAAAPRPLVESSGLPPGIDPDPNVNYVSLLLFYQYVEPPWSDAVYRQVLKQVEQIAIQHQVTGRMRVAREGFNCTLTTTSAQAMRDFCAALRRWKPAVFHPTEFKLTHHLPDKQRFRQLKIIQVQELVHYGLEGAKAPPIENFGGIHLEPADYHRQLADPDTVVIDVRNHYEANIGRFVPPTAAGCGGSDGDKFLDPNMRKSTEFPVWLDAKETREKLRNKSVAMYCTGGIRCERASALLRYKMATDPAVQALNIGNVYQLQGGIDKYFKQFPDGGYWRGVNYVFDKRFAHAPVEKEIGKHHHNKQNAEEEEEQKQQQPQQQPPKEEHGDDNDDDDGDDTKKLAAVAAAPTSAQPLGRCEACGKPWDQYRGKRRCPTCGVPSLICRDCWRADRDGTAKLDATVRCDLCVRQNITSKKKLRQREQRQLEAYERRLRDQGLLCPQQQSQPQQQPQQRQRKQQQQQQQQQQTAADPNPEKVTRLYLRNMCRHSMTEQALMEHLPGITHIVWNIRQGRHFGGQGWVEMETPQAAAAAVAKSGQKVLGRPLYIEYQPPGGKDLWPPPRSAVR